MLIRFRFSLLIAFLISIFSIADVDLTVMHPTIAFTTNNQKLRIEGLVSTDLNADLILTVNTPAGVENLIDLKHPLHAVVVELGRVQKINSLLIRPIVNPEFPRGPKRIKIAFSTDGNNFSENQNFNVSAQTDRTFRHVVVELDQQISAKFVRIELIESWQRDLPSLVESIAFLDDQDRVAQTRTRSISVKLDFTDVNITTQPFEIELLLNAGENRIVVSVEADLKSTEDPEQLSDREIVAVTYLTELTANSDGYIELSDGDRLHLLIPKNAFADRVQKLQIFRVDQIPSFLKNPQIAPNTSPITAYRFEALRRTSFSAIASNSLPYQPPVLAVDGKINPPSTWMTSLTPMPVELTIDLGQHYTIGNIIIHANFHDDRSFGPQSATILVSDDRSNFIKILDVEMFDDRQTKIDLPTQPKTRFVRLNITESKQINNIQINEIEFYDASDLKIIPFEISDHLMLRNTATFQFRYTDADLRTANADAPENLRFFAWDNAAQSWHFAGGSVDLVDQTVTLESNYITQFAIFQFIPQKISAVWNFNPFSPDGNGIADTTRLTITADATIDQRELVVEIFDLHSKLVRTLIDHAIISANSISVEWDGRDRSGTLVEIGPYIYQVRLASQISNGVIVVIK